MQQVYDYVIIGSGFGGSVSAMRLTEKGYSVLVLEKGKRFKDHDFAKTNWQFWKYLWLPALRAHGILQISILKGAMVLHGAGVGGGSLGYANVLEVPTEATFATPAWNKACTGVKCCVRITRRRGGCSARPAIPGCGRRTWSSSKWRRNAAWATPSAPPKWAPTLGNQA